MLTASVRVTPMNASNLFLVVKGTFLITYVITCVTFNVKKSCRVTNFFFK